jgi:predicted DNA-binding transcriptional regulator YafY
MTDLDEPRFVTIRYRNWRGEVADRRIMPHSIWFGSTQWHPESQWLLDALDLDRNEVRSFAMKDILEWRAIP